MSNKNIELGILKKIYRDDQVTIIESEQPDFIIDGDNEKFGVEITEYYYNESSARLKNKPGYFDSIINSDDPFVLTKKDKGMITKQSLYVKGIKDDKFKFLLDTVGVKFNANSNWNIDPSFEEVEKQLIEIIEVKSDKAEKYQSLDYHELFIYDKENYFARNAKRQVCLRGSKRLLEVVSNSRYKRVYIFSGDVLCIIGENSSENIKKYDMFKADKIVFNKGDNYHE